METEWESASGNNPSHTQPVIPGGLHSCRACFRFTGRLKSLWKSVPASTRGLAPLPFGHTSSTGFSPFSGFPEFAIPLRKDYFLSAFQFILGRDIAPLLDEGMGLGRDSQEERRTR